MGIVSLVCDTPIRCMKLIPLQSPSTTRATALYEPYQALQYPMKPYTRKPLAASQGGARAKHCATRADIPIHWHPIPWQMPVRLRPWRSRRGTQVQFIIAANADGLTPWPATPKCMRSASAFLVAEGCDALQSISRPTSREQPGQKCVDGYDSRNGTPLIGE